MNALLRRSNEARARLMRECNLDELDYQLLLLDAGCRVLERATPVEQDGSEVEARTRRELLAELGFWTWFEYEFRKMEVNLVEEWTRENAVALLQPTEVKREMLVEQTVGLSIYDHIWASYDHWLATTSPRKRKPQYEHETR